MKPRRAPWGQYFPPVLILADELAVKRHPDYGAAKAGDASAAARLVRDLATPEAIDCVAALLAADQPVVASVHAQEAAGVNAIPEALAGAIARRFNLTTDAAIVQSNVVNHTGADGFSRLARQALFDGDVMPGSAYLMVDDFIGQGGTLANLRGHIEAGGGTVIGAAVLTGRPFSATLALTAPQLQALRNKHGDLEDWWRARFGFGFDALTESEAHYLIRTPDAHTARDRIAAAEQAADG